MWSTCGLQWDAKQAEAEGSLHKHATEKTAVWSSLEWWHRVGVPAWSRLRSVLSAVVILLLLLLKLGPVPNLATAGIFTVGVKHSLQTDVRAPPVTNIALVFSLSCQTCGSRRSLSDSRRKQLLRVLADLQKVAGGVFFVEFASRCWDE